MYINLCKPKMHCSSKENQCILYSIKNTAILLCKKSNNLPNFIALFCYCYIISLVGEISKCLMVTNINQTNIKKTLIFGVT